MQTDISLNSLIDRLKRNKEKLESLRSVSLVGAQPTRNCPGVYLIFFEENLQYIGSSGNLFARLRNNLITGNRESHTLINKLCVLKGFDVDDAINWLRQNSRIKYIVTNSIDDARLLEVAMIALNHPYFNAPLRVLRKEPSKKANNERTITTHKLDEWEGTDSIKSERV